MKSEDYWYPDLLPYMMIGSAHAISSEPGPEPKPIGFIWPDKESPIVLPDQPTSQTEER